MRESGYSRLNYATCHFDVVRRMGAVKLLVLLGSAAVAHTSFGPVAVAAGAKAPETRSVSPQMSSPGRPAPGAVQTRLAQVKVDCAIFGSGYVQVQGTGNCVRIRSRMRIHENIVPYRGGDYPPFAGPSGANLPAGLRVSEEDVRRRWTR